MKKYFGSLILVVSCMACSACQNDQNPEPGADGATSESDVVTDTGTDAQSTCDINCLADRFLAMYTAMEPGCICDGISNQPVFDCGQYFDEAKEYFVSPRGCFARYFSDSELMIGIDEWIACREERIATRGPCISSLDPGDSCEQCPEFWDNGGDPCSFPGTEGDFLESCIDEMSGRPWE